MVISQRFPERERIKPQDKKLVLSTVGHLIILLPMLMQSNSAQSTVVSYDYGLDFSTTDQNTYATGPTGAYTSNNFLGFDTGPNPFAIGGIESVYSPQFLFIPSVYLGKYGAEIAGNFDLRTGFEVTTRNDSGTIDAAQSFQALLQYENTLEAGIFTDFMATDVSESQSMQTTFPNVGLDIDFVFELDDLYIDVTGCVVDCVDIPLIPHTNVAVDVPIFDFNRDTDGDGAPDGLVELFGVGIDEEFAAYQSDDETATVAGGEVTTKPSLTLNLEVPLRKGLSLGSVTVEVPQPHTEATELNGDSTLNSAAEDDFMEISIDVDTFLTIAIPPPAGPIINAINSNGITIPFTDFGAGYDLLNFQVAWDMDYSQEFTLMSNLIVDLAFSETVIWRNDAGVIELLDGWQGVWSEIPDFTLGHAGTVEVTPTFDLEATLRNLTELDYDLNFILELLKIWYDLGFANGEVALFQGNWPVDLFRSTVFDGQFYLEGWEKQSTAAPFLVNFTESSNSFETSTCEALPEGERADCYQVFVDETNQCNLARNWVENADQQDANVTCGTNPLYDGPANNSCTVTGGSSGGLIGIKLYTLFSAIVAECNGEEPAEVVYMPPVIVNDPVCTSCDEGIIVTTGTTTFSEVPEPHVLLLFGVGLGLLGFVSRRRG